MLVRLFVILRVWSETWPRSSIFVIFRLCSSIIEALNGRPSALQQSGATLRPRRIWTKSLSAEVGKWRNLKKRLAYAAAESRPDCHFPLIQFLRCCPNFAGSGADSACMPLFRWKVDRWNHVKPCEPCEIHVPPKNGRWNEMWTSLAYIEKILFQTFPNLYYRSLLCSMLFVFRNFVSY